MKTCFNKAMIHLFKKTFCVLAVSILFFHGAGTAQAAVILFQDDTFFDVQSDTVRIGSNDAGVSNTAIQFGNDVTGSENGNILWNITTNTFDVDHSVGITGGLTASGTTTLNGVANIGDGGDTVTVNSSTWDISSAGVASGFTGMTSTGAIDYTGATYRGPQGASDPATCSPGQEFYNTTSNLLKICTATNTWSPLLRTDTSQSFTSGTLTFNAGTTLSGNGVINFTAATSFRPPQGAADPGTCSVGQQFYNTTSNSMKVCTSTNTWTIAVSANGADLLDGVDSSQFLRSDASDNYTSGTLTTDNGTTFTVNGVANVGDGGDNITVNSNSWDVSSAGVGSGFTGFSSTGTVNFSGAGSMRIREVADEATATCTTVKEIVLDTTENKIYVCSVIGSPGTWVAPSAGASDFEGVYTADGDKVLTTSNGAFTINTGTNTFTVTGAATVNDANNAATNINNGATTGAVSIGSGSGTQSVTLGGGNTGVKTVTIGSTNTTSTTNIRSASGGVNVNASNNQPTNLNTGTSTGQVSLGGGSNCVAVNSNTWDATCAGVFSGLTGLTSTGNITLTNASTFFMPQASADPGTCTEGATYYNTTLKVVRLCSATNTWVSATPSSANYAAAYDTTSQTVTTPGTYQDITFSNNSQLDGWTHTAGTGVFTAAVPGLYLVNVTVLMLKGSGGSAQTGEIRATLNGAEIVGSQSGASFASNNVLVPLSSNFIMNVTTAGHVFRVQMTGSVSVIQITANGGGASTQTSGRVTITRIN